MSRTRSPLALYSDTARRSAAHVLPAYSTSFALASRLLAPAVRAHVAAIYALVRVADEIVDGPAQEAGLDAAARRATLDALEHEVQRAVASGFSPNLVVHAFALTARRTGFGTELTAPFFASMRRDLDPVELTEPEFREYVHGSAEVVGLMCLHAFLLGTRVDDVLRARLERGARHLGAAFQKVNFLRDLGEDYLTRGRRYFPGIDPAHLTETQKEGLVADIERDLAIAATTIHELPPGARRAVAAAHGLFAELTDLVRATPAHRLVRSRVSVPPARKAAVLLRAVVQGGPASAGGRA